MGCAWCRCSLCWFGVVLRPHPRLLSVVPWRVCGCSGSRVLTCVWCGGCGCVPCSQMYCVKQQQLREENAIQARIKVCACACGRCCNARHEWTGWSIPPDPPPPPPPPPPRALPNFHMPPLTSTMLCCSSYAHTCCCGAAACFVVALRCAVLCCAVPPPPPPPGLRPKPRGRPASRQHDGRRWRHGLRPTRPEPKHDDATRTAWSHGATATSPPPPPSPPPSHEGRPPHTWAASPQQPPWPAQLHAPTPGAPRCPWATWWATWWATTATQQRTWRHRGR